MSSLKPGAALEGFKIQLINHRLPSRDFGSFLD